MAILKKSTFCKSGPRTNSTGYWMQIRNFIFAHPIESGWFLSLKKYIKKFRALLPAPPTSLSPAPLPCRAPPGGARARGLDFASSLRWPLRGAAATAAESFPSSSSFFPLFFFRFPSPSVWFLPLFFFFPQPPNYLFAPRTSFSASPPCCSLLFCLYCFLMSTRHAASQPASQQISQPDNLLTIYYMRKRGHQTSCTSTNNILAIY